MNFIRKAHNTIQSNDTESSPVFVQYDRTNPIQTYTLLYAYTDRDREAVRDRWYDC